VTDLHSVSDSMSTAGSGGPLNGGEICEVCKNGSGNFMLHCRRLEGTEFVSYRYLVCNQCGCLALANVPEDLTPYYTRGYYSHELPSEWAMKRLRLASRLYFGFPGSPALRPLVDVPRPNNILSLVATMLKIGGKGPRESDLLDVGSGIGIFVTMMQAAGFRHLLGVDKFMTSQRAIGNRARVVPGDLSTIQDRFDYIVMNHSYEHLPNPIQTLVRVRQLLAENGVVMIRVPLCDSLAFAKYGCAWYALDPPRHLFLHTRRSMKIAAETAGLYVRAVRYDSAGSQFLKSEELAASLGDEPRMRGACWPKMGRNSVFDRIRASALARSVNRSGIGDQAAFFLSR
jgi:SAM-dependent methyltransferase